MLSFRTDITAIWLILLFSGVPYVRAQEADVGTQSADVDTQTIIPADSEVRILSDTELTDLLQQLQKKMSGVRSLRLQFQQTHHLSMLAHDVLTRGVCLFNQPEQLRFEIIDPFRSALVMSDGKVAKFEFDDNRWRKINIPAADSLRKATGQLGQWLTGQFDAQRKIYLISAEQAEYTTIVLTPRSAELGQIIQRIDLRIAFDPLRVSQVTVHEPGGDYTELKFVTEDKDWDIPQGAFDLTGTSLGLFKWFEPEESKSPQQIGETHP